MVICNNYHGIMIITTLIDDTIIKMLGTTIVYKYCHSMKLTVFVGVCTVTSAQHE